MRTLTTIFILSLISLTAFAGNNQPPEPPKEAFTACAGLKVGAVCTSKGMNGETMSGICRQTQTGIACAPNGGQPPRKPDNSDKKTN